MYLFFIPSDKSVLLDDCTIKISQIPLRTALQLSFLLVFHHFHILFSDSISDIINNDSCLKVKR